MDCDSKSMWFRTLGVEGGRWEVGGGKEGRRHEGSIKVKREWEKEKEG